MKNLLIALLLIAVVLFVAAEAKRQRGSKGKPGGRGQKPLRKVNKGEFCFSDQTFYQLSISLASLGAGFELLLHINYSSK